MSETLLILVNNIIKELQEINEYNREFHKDIKDIDIPFCIASITQYFKNNKTNLSKDPYFTCFIEDLKKYEYYIYCSDVIRDIDYGNLDVEIVFPKQRFKYIIQFKYDDRFLKYCECNSLMKDYRADKHCCGYNCDWAAPAFTLEKIFTVCSGSWEGNQRSYWDFEDNFYNKNQALKIQKQKIQKEKEITQLKSELVSIKQKLKELYETN